MKRVLWLFLMLFPSATAQATQSASEVAAAPSFRLVSAYEGLARFVAAARAESAADRQALHQKFAVAPFGADCRANTGNFRIPDPTTDLDTLAARVDMFRQAGVEGLVLRALERAHAVLPTPEMTVCINLAHPTPVTRVMKGMGGGAIRGNRILLLIDPSVPDSWWRLVPYTLAHEYHHEVAIAQFGAAFTDAISIMINEGRADAFASILFPDAKGPWTEPLDAQRQAEFLAVIDPLLDEIDGEEFYERFMFGRQEGIPRWAGYRTGLRIVEDYLREHPELTVREWTGLHPSTIWSSSPRPKEVGKR